MSKTRVFFRTDANSQIGMGHLVRCAALAAMLRENFSVTFLTSHTPAEVREKILGRRFAAIEIEGDDFSAYRKYIFPGDILVLDGYNFDTDYQAKVKATGIKSVYIDDLHSFVYSADVIINQSDSIKESDYKTIGQTQFCLGPKYALLRPPFLEAAKKEKPAADKISSVFLSFGGADMHNVTQKVLRVVSAFNTVKEIHVLSGSVNENINTWKKQFDGHSRIHFHSNLDSGDVCTLMNKCQLALCPASSLSLELCAVGIVLLTGTTAANQQGYYDSLTQKSAALGIGNWMEVSEEDLKGKLAGMLIYDEKDIARFIKSQRNYIDGLSGERLLNVFRELAA